MPSTSVTGAGLARGMVAAVGDLGGVDCAELWLQVKSEGQVVSQGVGRVRTGVF